MKMRSTIFTSVTVSAVIIVLTILASGAGVHVQKASSPDVAQKKSVPIQSKGRPASGTNNNEGADRRQCSTKPESLASSSTESQEQQPASDNLRLRLEKDLSTDPIEVNDSLESSKHESRDPKLGADAPKCMKEEKVPSAVPRNPVNGK